MTSNSPPLAPQMPVIRRQLAAPHALVRDLLPAALKTEGFGVLTEIDIEKTLQDKLGAEFRPYTILGACNPVLAQRALAADLEVGVLLPCNIVVQAADGGGTLVSAVDPQKALGAFGNSELQALAGEVRERLVKVLDKLG